MKESLLRKLYVDELKDLHSAENQLISALPKMAKGGNFTQTQSRIRRPPKTDRATRCEIGENIQGNEKEGPHGKHCSLEKH
jgi:ferritin-like metal-binding protein YciE